MGNVTRRFIALLATFNIALAQCAIVYAEESSTESVNASSISDSNSSSGNSSSESSGNYKIDNDGTFREANEIYGDSGLESSFVGVEYYDCYVPYNQTCEEVGGYTSSMSSYARNSHVGDFINFENDMFNFSGGDYWTNWNTGGKEGYEADTTLATLTDDNGTVYYVAAFPYWLWRYDKSFYNWGFQGKGNPEACGGEIIDVICTDGTCIHFVVGDAKAEVHTNGGGTGASPDSVVYSNFETTNLSKHPHYANMFQAEGGEIVEIWGKWGSHSKFWEKYNFKYVEGTGNHIAYLRMYNKKISDNPKPASEACKSVAHKVSGGKSGNNPNTVDIASGLLSEEDFVSLPQLSEFDIALPTSEGLGILYNSEVANWRNDIDYNNQAKVLSYERALIMLLGIVLCIYGLLLYLAFHFDSVNNFVDIELLSILSFGRFIVAPDGRSSTWRSGARPQAIIHRDALIMFVLVEAVGVLITSGKIFSVISKVIHTVESLF